MRARSDATKENSVGVQVTNVDPSSPPREKLSLHITSQQKQSNPTLRFPGPVPSLIPIFLITTTLRRRMSYSS